MNNKFPLRVQIRIYPKSKGGKDICRKDIIVNDEPITFNEYRGVIYIQLQGSAKEEYLSAFFTLPDNKEFLCNNEYAVKMALVSVNENSLDKFLYKGQTFKLWENVFFGEGKILEIPICKK